MDRIGRYEILGRIGSGGFATVYRVRDPVLDSEVAVKVLADNWSGDAEIRDRFIREAQLLRRIDSDRVVTVHDIGELPTGQPYFVMALADRGTLEDRLQAKPQPEPAGVVAIADRMADCVGTVHSHDLIHRDIKPGNLLIAASRSSSVAAGPSGLLEPFERLVLGDFGLAKDLALQASGLTIAAGTGGYAAPEQMTPGGSPDRRTDLYAATGVMYRVISGTIPPRYDLGARTVPLDDADWWMAGALGAFFRRGMAFDQAHRHHSIEAWHAELAAAMAPFHPAGATVPSSPGPPPPPPPLSAPPPPPDSLSTSPLHGAGDTHRPAVPHRPTSLADPPPAPPRHGGGGDGGSDGPGAWSLDGDARTGGRRTRRGLLGLVAALAVVAVVGIGALYYALRPAPEITGPDEIEAGTAASYTAAFDGATGFRWTDWNGAVLEATASEAFDVEAIVAGTLTFSVVALSDGDEVSASTSRTVTVVPSTNPPTIDGPGEVAVGDSQTYTYSPPAGRTVTGARWIDAATGEWKEGASYTLTPEEPGPFTITLAVTLDDGTQVGTTREVQIVERGS